MPFRFRTGSLWKLRNMEIGAILCEYSRSVHGDLDLGKAWMRVMVEK
jgi:hypothetical protein